MAYAKIQKAIQDYGIGFQSINQARDNIDAVRAFYAFEHNTSDALGFVGYNSLPGYGQHNHSAIPKSVLIATPSSYTLVTGQLMWTLAVSVTGRVIRGVVRFQKGIYIVTTDPLAKASATVTATATTTTKRIAKASPLPVSTGQSGWIVALKEQSAAGAVFSAADFAFHFRVWGQ